MKQQNTVVIANIAGNTVEEYCQMAEKLSETDADMIELNISCPNVKAGGAAFGVSTEGASLITRTVREVTKKPVMMKLSPHLSVCRPFPIHRKRWWQ